MRFEWLLLGLMLGCALLPVARKLRSGWAWLALIALALLTASGGAVWQKHVEREAASRQQMLAKTPREGRPGGYVGSDSCRSCHPSQYDSWHGSFHRTMTQHATPASVR